MERRRRTSAILGITLGILLLGSMAPCRAEGQAAVTPAPELGDPSRNFGNHNAPIIMEVFSDFECPSCRALFEQTLKPLMNDYVVSGKVYLVHHDFPLPMHKYSRVAARWASAAAKTGHYREAEAALFDNQVAWSENGDMAKFLSTALGPADFGRAEKYMQVGCLQNDSKTCALDAEIERDIALGKQHQVNATPTFVVTAHGKSTTSSGVVTYEVLKQYFDYLLNQK
jgi:protein-disulfide isomerase